MTSLKNKRNLLRLIAPGAIILIVILLGVAALFLLKGPNSIQGGVTKQISNYSASANVTNTVANNVPPANKAIQLPVFDITKRPVQPSTSNETDYLKWMSSNTTENQNYLTAKWDRSRAIITNQDAVDPRILEAFLRTPRELFCPAGASPIRAYGKYPIPIGYGQTISGAHLVAHMTQAIDPQPGQKVLEIGTGSGYQSAVLSELSNHVYTIEIVPQLAKKADALYTKLTKGYPEYANINRKNADGYYGWPENAPFDRIIVTAGIDHVPPDLLSQLTSGGIMVIPVGPPSGQTILKITKEVLADGSISFKREDIYNGKKVIFVPFTAGQGIHSNTSN
jgi:protein-L-isoaspartate(D-aspartate) O-methyltransferase